MGKEFDGTGSSPPADARTGRGVMPLDAANSVPAEGRVMSSVSSLDLAGARVERARSGSFSELSLMKPSATTVSSVNSRPALPQAVATILPTIALMSSMNASCLLKGN